MFDALDMSTIKIEVEVGAVSAGIEKKNNAPIYKRIPDGTGISLQIQTETVNLASR